MATKVAVLKVEFTVLGHRHDSNNLVSPFGVLMVFDEVNAPKGIEEALGFILDLKVNGQPLTGRILKEMHSGTSYYSIQFEEGQGEVLKDLIESQGAAMPPRRKYARLDAQREVAVPLPQYAVVSKPGRETFFYTVVNFTIGGILIESFGSITSKLDVGSKVHFDLLISDNSKILGISAEVVRMKDTISEQLLGEKCTQYGLRILDMDKLAYNKYRQLILNYCNFLNKEVA